MSATIVFLVLTIPLAIWLLWRSGTSPLLDEVAAAAARTGVEMKSQRIKAGDVYLHIVCAGPQHGPTVLLLHGFPEYWYSWHKQLAGLARNGYRAIALDLKGYNRSDKPRPVRLYDADHLVSDILALLDALNVTDCLMAGHDIGGKLLWRIALLHPERVRKAIIFNSVHPLAWQHARPQDDKETISWFRTFLRLPWLPELVGRMRRFRVLTRMLQRTSQTGAFSDAVLDYYRSAWCRDNALSTMFNSYRTGEKYEIDQTCLPANQRPVPVRVVWGRKDAFFPPGAARLTAQLVGPDSFVEVPHATHWIVVEEPELTLQQMLLFFGDQRLAATSETVREPTFS